MKLPLPKGAGLYEIRNTACGRRYVGSSVTLRRRIDTHKFQLRHGQHPNVRLQRAWDRDGEAAFQFTVLVRLEESEVLPTEQRLLDRALMSGEAIYNFALHADAPMRGRTPSAESRERMAEGQRRRYQQPGVREAQSKRMKRFLSDPKERERWSALRRKDNANPELIARKSATCKAAWTPELRAQASLNRTGKKRSAAARQNMRQAQGISAGKPERRRKLSEAAKARWADPAQREKLLAAISAGVAAKRIV